MKRNTMLAMLVGLLMLPSQVAAQGTLTGVVTNADTGEPLAGAQISVVGTTVGGSTDNEGRYVLTGVPAGTQSITAQFIGFTEGRAEQVQIATGQTVTQDFSLEVQVLSLDKVVVTGVGEATTSVRTPFAVSKIDATAAGTVPPTTEALGALQGKIAGAYMVPNDGQPGSDVQILLRTPTALGTNASAPLIVVDGIIINTFTCGGNDTNCLSTSADIAAEDIESIEVVKGAAASSLYGAKAAGGVISITTKRGRDLDLNQTRVRLRTEYGKSALPRKIALATHHAFAMNAAGTAFVDEDGNPTDDYGDRVIDEDRVMDNEYFTPLFTDKNISELLRGGDHLTSSLELSHSSAATNFLATLRQQKTEGQISGNEGLTVRNFRLNLDHRLRDDFSLSVSAYHSRTFQDQLATRNGLFNIWNYQPDFDLTKRDADGAYLPWPDSTYTVTNPAWTEATRDNFQYRSRTLVSGDIRYNPLTWLSVRGNLAYDRADNDSYDYTAKGIRTDFDDEDDVTDGSLDMSHSANTAWNGAGGVTLLRNFGQLSARLTGQAQIEVQDQYSHESRADDFTVPNVADMNWALDENVSSSTSQRKSEGYYGQLGLDYAGKYIGDFLFRYDGSSLFGPEERWHPYMRGAVAYRMALEPWWPIDWMSEFKLHYSIGSAGGRPGFSDQYEVWTSSNGLPVKNTLGNRFLKPSQTVEHEAGLDVAINNKYLLQLVYARQVSSDQILSLTLPAISGYSSQRANAGEITGHTYEMTFEAQLVNQTNFNWRTTVVADHSSSEITEWERACIGYVNSLGITCEGAENGEMHGNRFIRSFDQLPTSLEPYRDQLDINDDGYVVWVGEGNTWRDGFAKDLWGTTVSVQGFPVPIGWGYPLVEVGDDGQFQKVEIGYSVPELNFGWVNSFNYRGVLLYSTVRGQLGGETYNNTRRNMYTGSTDRHGDLDQFGKSEETKKPLGYYDDGLGNGAWFVNDEYVEDATFLKLSELAVQYRFNNEQLSGIGLGGVAQSLSLGLIGRNLLLLTPYNGLDPEVGGIFFRVDQWYYPQVRTITATAEITF